MTWPAAIDLQAAIVDALLRAGLEQLLVDSHDLAEPEPIAHATVAAKAAGALVHVGTLGPDGYLYALNPPTSAPLALDVDREELATRGGAASTAGAEGGPARTPEPPAAGGLGENVPAHSGLGPGDSLREAHPGPARPVRTELLGLPLDDVALAFGIDPENLAARAAEIDRRLELVEEIYAQAIDQPSRLWNGFRAGVLRRHRVSRLGDLRLDLLEQAAREADQFGAHLSHRSTS